MVNNYDIIKDALDFPNEKSFYFIQVLKRKKENPKMKSYSIPIESYYIFSKEQFERVMPHIIDRCEENRARAYIKMNCLDIESVALKNISLLAQGIRDKDWKHLSSYFNAACGQCGKQDGTSAKYLVDMDDVTEKDIKDIEHIINFECEPISNNNKVFLKVPTKHGFHFITTGFDIQHFKNIRTNVDIHKDGITLLYYPECCESDKTNLNCASFEKFVKEVMDEAEKRPEFIRKGQAVFNYVDEFYGVARTAQHKHNIDCFYDDSKIDDFLKICYNLIKEKQ